MRIHETLPGRQRNLLFSLSYLTLLVVLPLVFLVLSVRGASWSEVMSILSDRRVLDAFKISFSLSIWAAAIDLAAGTVIAWTLIKYRFYGRNFLDAIVDLPFAMPTAISGIALATIYSKEGWIGKYLERIGIEVSYTPLGILVALVFVGLPFVVRALQPAIEVLDQEMEEAASSLGASRATVLRKIIFPQLLPALVTGFTMSLARGLGEYGSVIFIAGNVPFVSEIVPYVIMMKLEEFHYKAAAVISVAMLAVSFLLLLLLGVAGNFLRRRYA